MCNVISQALRGICSKTKPKGCQCNLPKIYCYCECFSVVDFDTCRTCIYKFMEVYLRIIWFTILGVRRKFGLVAREDYRGGKKSIRKIIL